MMIYLDNSATTKPYKEVIKTYATVAETYFANPSSLHKKGGDVERLLQQARRRSADLLKVKANELRFTSGGTEGNNLAIKGTIFYNQSRGSHLITTEVEHASVYDTFQQLESIGFEVTYLPVNQYGLVSLDDLEKAIRPDTIFVSMIHVNNELGTVQPVEKVGKLLQKHPKIYFHVDHVQGATKVSLNMREAGIDLCTMSAHKFHGLKGNGLLYIREGVNVTPLFSGGNQEGGTRSGTENVPGIVAMVKALRLSFERSKQEVPKIAQLQSQLRKELKEIDGVTINTPETSVAPHIINFSVSGIKPEVLVHALEENDIYVSTKSACSSKQDGASHVLLAMGLSKESASQAIRISLSFENNKTEVEKTIRALTEAITHLQSVKG